MMSRKGGLVALVAYAIPAMALAGGADEQGAITPKAAFATLKTLAGDWKADLGGGHSSEVRYRVTAGGSVVMETSFPGTDHEMVTMYHLDGDSLRLTHYCASGNQPHLKFDPKGSTAEKFSFVFEGGTNLDPAKDAHMHAGRIAIADAKHITSEWDAYAQGKKAGTHKIALTRP